MCAGKDLRPGDYVFGWDQPHGPYEYPDGCEVFVVLIGEGTQYIWDETKHRDHRNIWEAETEEGQKGIEEQKAIRQSSTSIQEQG